MLVTKILVCLIMLLLIGGYFINSTLTATVPPQAEIESDHYDNGKFHNAVTQKPLTLKETVSLWIKVLTEKKVGTIPTIDIPVLSLSKDDLAMLSNDTLHIIKLGHSSILLKISGEYWLIDPVFSERVSPFSFAGPKRFHQPPIALADLPPIDKVLISHNHYDHLDKASIKDLAKKAKAFLVPKGVEGDLELWGVEQQKIKTFDWWQEEKTDNAMIAFTPAQHFSGRAMGDGNTTLWGSWVIKTPQGSIYFSGDSGYFAGFKTIGDQYGPFNLTMIETGAYNKNWSTIHMTPEESVQAHIDLQGEIMIPIHNGTFDLAFHTWHDPFDRVSTAAAKHSVALSTPVFGQVLSITDPAVQNKWWEAESSN